MSVKNRNGDDESQFLYKYSYADTTDQATANQDIERLALALAPQVAELEDILRDMPGMEAEGAVYTSGIDVAASTSMSMELEDDDLDDEIHNLEMSEQLLREELEFAQTFGSGMLQMTGGGVGGVMEEEDSHARHARSESETDNDKLQVPEEEEVLEPDSIAIDRNRNRNIPQVSTSPVAYTLQHHAEHLWLSTEKMGGWYYMDVTRYLLTEPPATVSNPQPQSSIIVKEYCLPVPYRKLKRLYCGLSFHDVTPPPAPPPVKTPTKPTTTTTIISKASPLSPTTPPGSGNHNHNDNQRQSLLSTPSPQHHPPPPTPTPSLLPITINNPAQEEPLPFRTLSIQIRPDVLCGAVMDAISHSLDMLPHPHVSRIIKRQGGHLRGAVSLTIHPSTKHNNNHNNHHTPKDKTPKETFSYVCDAQLCTFQSDMDDTLGIERRLVIRLYHIQDDPEAAYELAQTLAQSSPETTDDILQDYREPGPNPQTARKSTRHLKQCCSLIQRLMAQQQQAASQNNSNSDSNNNTASWLGLKDTAFSSKRSMQQAIGQHLEGHYKKCPSVREENKKVSVTIRRLTLPSLSSKDYPMLLHSWTLVANLVEELSTRDCTWNTLPTILPTQVGDNNNNNNNDDSIFDPSQKLPFGQFPSLPTLDVHYCSQLRRLSREAMITQLLKSAKELEDYAKSAEYNCANLITLLEPMMRYYQVPPVTLPTPKPLEDYPLEFTPPQVSCPPWGQPVMEALNRVAALTSTGAIDAAQATNRVYAAFTKQDDGEQGARLGRKNAQVMERLSNMQSHQRTLIHALRDAHIHSQVARRARDEFTIKAQSARNVGQEGHPRQLLLQVPLLTFRISVGASLSGTCYITANQMLLSTSYIPLVGGIQTTLLDLSQVQFRYDETVASTLLNPFPNTFYVMSLEGEETIFSFRPSLGAKRLHNFLTNFQSFQDEATTDSDFAQPDQILDEDGVFRLADTISEDQLSI
jgi:hypothetical protein